jgi:elongation factor Ts
VKELRNRTNAPLSLIKRILTSCNDDVEKAENQIRANWVPPDKETAFGLIHNHVHQDRIGVMLELRCCTDFVGKTAEFRNLAHELALQLVAGLEGPLEEQEWVKDASRKVGDLIKEVAGKTGETIKVGHVIRWEV